MSTETVFWTIGSYIVSLLQHLFYLYWTIVRVFLQVWRYGPKKAFLYEVRFWVFQLWEMKKDGT